jgi:hypothetical protein
VQFDCRYRGIVAVSSREGRLLGTPLSVSSSFSSQPSLFSATPGGNRTLSEAFVFKYGALPEEYTRPKKRKTFLGVGVELRSGEKATPDENLFLVSEIRPGGPASRAGVRPGDRVLSIDGAFSRRSRFLTAPSNLSGAIQACRPSSSRCPRSRERWARARRAQL